MMISVELLKEFIEKGENKHYLDTEYGSETVIYIEALLDFINANQVECEVIKNINTTQFISDIWDFNIEEFDDMDYIIIVKKPKAQRKDSEL